MIEARPDSHLAALRRAPLRSAALAVALLGMLALAARPVGLISVGVVAAVGLAGLLAPVPPGRSRGPVAWTAAGLLGMAAFASVRALAGPAVPGPYVLAPAVAIVAAVAEEAFFRRFLYGALAPWGAVVAVLGTSLAFALAHVPGYGWPAFPLNLGAGLIFGWQRWVTGGWSAPAASHALANVLAYL